MRHAETVTFGGSALDRAGELRGKERDLSQRIAAGKAETIIMWRGKPLVRAGAHDALVRLPMDHPILHFALMPPVFLGRELPERLIFAHDISFWQPDDLDGAALAQFNDPTEQHHPDLPGDMVFAELRRIMTALSPRNAELAATAKAILGWHVSHRFCAQCGTESVMTLSGWQRNCPACSATHFPRTDPVVIMLITHGNAALLGRSHGWPEGMHSLLAGYLEPGETIEAAVRREVFEEAGIRVGDVSYLASQPWAFPSSLMIGCRGHALDTEITLDPVELETALWLTREEMLDAFTGRRPGILPAREGSIAHFLIQNWLADRLD